MAYDLVDLHGVRFNLGVEYAGMSILVVNVASFDDVYTEKNYRQLQVCNRIIVTFIN